MAAHPPFLRVALLLQGGGALGSYQAGVYEALAEADLHPDWVAGISIGAINSALIAGNAPAERVDKLRTFWQEVTANPLLDWAVALEGLSPRGDFARGLFNHVSATSALMSGAANFFELRQPLAWLHPNGALEATSLYETKPLKATLERLVDFDRINSGEMRFSVGAVNVRSGNFVYFDTSTHTIRPEHVMASGSLPPGLPAIEIESEYYWDGGLISNTPLQWVVDFGPRQDTLAFQVDLWSAYGELPDNLAEVASRQKEIQYSSRTRATTDKFKEVQALRCALARLLEQLPPELRNNEDVKLLSTAADHKVYNIVQLIYRSKQYEGHSKDYEFSGCRWRSTGAPATTTPWAHYAIPRSWSTLSASRQPAEAVMHTWLSIPLAIGVLALSAVTASAGDRSPPRYGGHFHTVHHHDGPVTPGHVLARVIRDPRYLEEGAWDRPYETYGVSAIPSAPDVVVIQAPRRPEAEERPTVEMTPSGVQIVRGPGSRHIIP